MIPLEKFNIKIINKRLTKEEFSPQTIFINNLNPLRLRTKLLELVIEEGLKIEIGETRKCYLPNIPVFNIQSALPEDCADKGINLAYFNTVRESGLNKIPAIVEFAQGRLVLNFDVYSAINFIRKEGYLVNKRPFYTYLPVNIQNTPQGVRLFIFRCLKQLNKIGKAQCLFPPSDKNCPADTLMYLFLYCVQKIINANPGLNVWPGGKRYAFCLTHDIDSDWIYKEDNLNTFLDIENRLNIRGAWFFVANLYRHDFSKLDLIAREGHEIGIHGDNHDHKIAFLAEEQIRKRLSACRWFIERYHVIGFRSPHYLRTPKLYDVLKDYVRYDTSMHDYCDRNSGASFVRQGCATLFPFRLSKTESGLLELPITVTEDFELWTDKKDTGYIMETQLEQINKIKKRNALAMFVAHPEPHFTARRPFLEVFKKIITHVSSDRECWVCRPRDIYDYWTEKRDILQNIF